ncbi:MAG: HAD family hydrolase [Bdellovibrionota bacterium]
MTPFSHLVFDLDDTLLDTYGLLVPQASRDACTAMIAAGLSTDLTPCMNLREELGRSGGRGDVYGEIVARFGVRAGAEPSAVAAKGSDAFYNRRVSGELSLFRGAREMLRELKSRYELHLVTAGQEKTQHSKIEALNLGEIFQSIHVIDYRTGRRKGDAFAAIQHYSKLAPDLHLSIGNRLDSDIADAKRLGWKTCWVQYGEHADDSPQNEFETADYTIDGIEELVVACRL